MRGFRASLRNSEDVYPTLLTNQTQNSLMIPRITASYHYVKQIHSLPTRLAAIFSNVLKTNSDTLSKCEVSVKNKSCRVSNRIDEYLMLPHRI